MSTSNFDNPVQSPPARWCFDRYVLDLKRGCLLLDGDEITLRPKTFAVLQHLVENANRLVSKEEIFASVWPSISVTDDTLVQSIGELRRALGEDGLRLIRTIPRRGYRLESPVSLVPVDEAVNGAGPSAPRAEDDTAFRSEIGPHVVRSDSPLTDAGVSAPIPTIKIAQDERSGGPHPAATTRLGWLKTPVGLGIAAVAVLLAAGIVSWGTIDHVRRSYGNAQTAKSRQPHSGLAAKPLVAVLPFANQTDGAARGYFVDGLTQDIISALGRFSGITVMSWNAVHGFAGERSSPSEIASRLGVRYQVEGQARRAGDHIRVAAQLVRADGSVIWSGQFEGAAENLSGLSGKITARIAGALAIRVSEAELRRVLAKPAENLEAYDYALRARPALRRPGRQEIVEARRLLKRAIELDPAYAAAYASLAETYVIDLSWGWAQSPADSLSRAEEMANAALRLNDTEVQARAVLGRIHLYYQRYDRAKAELEHAIAINPSDARGLAGLGNTLMWLGETDAAIGMLEQAQRIDPELNAVDRFALAMAYYLERRYDAASRQAEINLRNSASARSTRALLAAAYAQDKRPADAARITHFIRRADPTFDPRAFGNKLQDPADFAHLQLGLRKAGLRPSDGNISPLHQ